MILQTPQEIQHTKLNKIFQTTQHNIHDPP